MQKHGLLDKRSQQRQTTCVNFIPADNSCFGIC